MTSATATGAGPARTLSYQYDAAGNRTQMTWPDTGGNALYVSYVYDVLDRVTQIEENGATSGPGLLASYAYDSLGRRQTISRAGGTGAGTGYTYDGASRLYTLAQTMAGSASVTYTLGYNAASQVTSRLVSNDSYTAHPAALSYGYTANGLNQYTSVTGPTATYTASNSAALTYDPTGALQSDTNAGGTTTFLYDGANLVGEYAASGSIVSRYVPGPGVDEPVTWYSGAGTATRNWLLADGQGSVISYADQNANSGATYTYGPYGEPITSTGASAWGGSRYRYTGQIEIPEAQLYYYKARVYDPATGRFQQTDPAASDLNLYAYATEDPLNKTDPTGLDTAVQADACANSATFVPDGNGGYIQVADLVVCPAGSSPGALGVLGGAGGSTTSSGDNGKGTKPPQSNQPPCNGGAARQYGISYSGNLFGILGGASLSVTVGVSIPSGGAGAQGFIGGEFDPMVGLGVNAGTSIGPTWGHSPTAVETGFNPTGSHVEGGAGLAYGAGIGQTVLPDGTVSTSVGLAGPPLPALKAGAYVGAGPAFSGQLATPQLGCHR